MSKFTRRELAAALSTSTVLLARPQGQPAPPAATPDDELAAARSQFRDNANLLDKFSLPMAVEPATTFKP
jgi:hypothetical protein